MFSQVNCNLEGVMVTEVLNYSPAVEMLRVPLIVSSPKVVEK